MKSVKVTFATYLIGMADVGLVAVVIPSGGTRHEERPDLAAVGFGVLPGLFDLLMRDRTGRHCEEAAKDQKTIVERRHFSVEDETPTEVFPHLLTFLFAQNLVYAPKKSLCSLRPAVKLMGLMGAHRQGRGAKLSVLANIPRFLGVGIVQYYSGFENFR